MNNIKFIKGNIFTSRMQTLVNTINCMGVMGRGIALEFKYRFPLMFEQYSKFCDENYIEIGKLWIYNIPKSNNKILNFPTKKHWKYPSKLEYLEKGLNKFLETYKEKGITSIAFPMLGALNGGLDPEKVILLMSDYLSYCDIPVEIYEFDKNAKDDLIDLFKISLTNYSLKELENLIGLKINTLKQLKLVFENNDIRNLIQLEKIKGIGDETIKSCYLFAMKLKDNQNISQSLFVNIFGEENLQVANMSSFNNYEKTYGLSEKVTLTGLDVQTIQKIENKDEVSIIAIKTYCKALKINFEDFILNNYVSVR